MINLLPVGKVIILIATIYAAVIAGILSFTYNLNSTPLVNIVFAFKGATYLNLLLLFTFYFGWKLLWKAFPKFNYILFPDLNGEWDMEIHWRRGDEHGVANATAHIKQDFLTISMDVISNDSESHTLLAKPQKDSHSGRPILFYMYRNIPKRKDGNQNSPYDGTAILKLDFKDINNLKGNYYTDRLTQGHYELSRKLSS